VAQHIVNFSPQLLSLTLQSSSTITIPSSSIDELLLQIVAGKQAVPT
jgi:hypothetical protein